jgi:hypothetical protein
MSSLVLLLAVSVTTQAPSLQFRNAEMGGQRFNVWVWCERDRGWANNSQAIALRPGKSSKLNLHTGYFVVVVRNQYGVEHRTRRVLSPSEVDRLKFVGLYSGPQNRPDFAITDDNNDDRE